MSAIVPHLLEALALAATMQGVAWVSMLRTRNAGLVDLTWAASLGAIAILLAFRVEGDLTRRLITAVVVGLWSTRLTWHLWRDRIHRRPEEGRYRRLREIWGARADAHFLWFFQAQAVLAAILALPFALAMHSTARTWTALDVAAVVLFAVAWSGEALADRQLAAFKRETTDRGQVCRRGLWKYSRHPNYFFDWLIWCAFALLALNAPQGGWGALSPLLILIFVTRITGIPPTEAQALRSRGDAYREYQRTTSALVPLPPRRG